jgi:hypothetical protein
MWSLFEIQLLLGHYKFAQESEKANTDVVKISHSLEIFWIAKAAL